MSTAKRQRTISFGSCIFLRNPGLRGTGPKMFGVLKRAELDARKSNGEHSEATNPLDYLAEIFNDYENFCPQNAMVRYVSPGTGSPPVKKQPYQASGSE